MISWGGVGVPKKSCVLLDAQSPQVASGMIFLGWFTGVPKKSCVLASGMILGAVVSGRSEFQSLEILAHGLAVALAARHRGAAG